MIVARDRDARRLFDDVEKAVFAVGGAGRTLVVSKDDDRSLAAEEPDGFLPRDLPVAKRRLLPPKIGEPAHNNSRDVDIKSAEVFMLSVSNASFPVSLERRGCRVRRPNGDRDIATDS